MGNSTSQPTTFEIRREDPPFDIDIDRKIINNLAAAEKDDLINDTVMEKVQYELDLERQKRIVFENKMAEQVTKESDELIARQKEIPQLQFNRVFEESEEKLILCYKNNPTKVLDCQKEVEAFKAAERVALQTFVQQQECSPQNFNGK